jgi:hypothetical protein
MFGSKDEHKNRERNKFEYESAVSKCYKFDRVTLALNGLNFTSGFNVEAGVVNRTYHEVYDDDFVMHGILAEYRQNERRVRCSLKLLDSANDCQEIIGEVSLTHGHFNEAEFAAADRDQRDLLLLAFLNDPTKKYRMLLHTYLRDAAISGFRFMHVALDCTPSEKDEEERSPVEQLREDGYGPVRRIKALRTTPTLILPNTPIWARPNE